MFFNIYFFISSISTTNMSDNTFMPLQRPAVPNRSATQSRRMNCFGRA